MLVAIASEYLCALASTNGQSGDSSMTVIAPMLQADRRVLYLGDWDHQGHQIEAATRRTLEHHIDEELDWELLAVTDEQVDEHDLRPFLIKKKDKRYKPTGVHDAIETETLGQRIIVDLVRDRLDDLLPEPLEERS
jgi:hypothetical protein